MRLISQYVGEDQQLEMRQKPPSIEMTDEDGKRIELEELKEAFLKAGNAEIRSASLASEDSRCLDMEAFNAEDVESTRPKWLRWLPSVTFEWPCGLSNFHVSLIVGVAGFFVFWLGLLLRIYLPHEYFT